MDEMKHVFNYDFRPTIRVYMVSFSEKWALNHETLGFPFIKGFPSHEWNDTRPLMMIAGQLYECQKIRVAKSEW